MRVVWVSHRSGLAGAEQALAEGAAGLVAAGHDVIVVLPAAGPLRDRLHGAGARCVVLPHARWAVGPGRRRCTRRVAVNARAVPRLVRLLRRERPDVVVTNTLTVPAGALAARLARVPHVWYAHELPAGNLGLRFDLGVHRSLRLADRLSALVLANSATVAAALAAHGVRSRVVHYAVTVPDRDAPAPPAPPFRLVLVATLQAQKGQEDAVRALRALRDDGVDARLRLVGPGAPAETARLRALADGLGVGREVELAGATDDPAAEVLAAHVALTCARDEAFGRTTVEALKLGRPVAGAASGATPELVRDGETGLLYPPGDAAALADRLVALARDPALAARLGEAARTWAREAFTAERHAAELEHALADAAARRRA